MACTRTKLLVLFFFLSLEQTARCHVKSDQRKEDPVKILFGIGKEKVVEENLARARARADGIVSKIEDWLDTKENTIRLSLTDADIAPGNGLEEQNYPEAERLGPFFSLYSPSTDAGTIFISIGFAKKVTSHSTAEELQKSLKYVALDKLPLPDFEYPQGWEIYPRTPVSSFKHGVKIVSFENGRIHYTIDTTFFKIYGMMKDVHRNRKLLPGSYFQVRRNIRGVIDINMPLLFENLYQR